MSNIFKLARKIDKYGDQLSWLEHLDFRVNVAEDEGREVELLDQHRKVARSKEKINKIIKALAAK